MPEFHPILATDYFEYGTTTNRLDKDRRRRRDG